MAEQGPRTHGPVQTANSAHAGFCKYFSWRAQSCRLVPPRRLRCRPASDGRTGGSITRTPGRGGLRAGRTGTGLSFQISATALEAACSSVTGGTQKSPMEQMRGVQHLEPGHVGGPQRARHPQHRPCQTLSPSAMPSPASRACGGISGHYSQLSPARCKPTAALRNQVFVHTPWLTKKSNDSISSKHACIIYSLGNKNKSAS